MSPLGDQGHITMRKKTTVSLEFFFYIHNYLVNFYEKTSETTRFTRMIIVNIERGKLDINPANIDILIYSAVYIYTSHTYTNTRRYNIELINCYLIPHVLNSDK